MLRLTRSHITGALLSLLLGVTAASAQHSTEPSLGEVARAERQRRAAQPHTPPARVLTNEDLRRERILPVAEPAPVAAAPAGDAPPAVAAEVVAVPAGPEVSLGEYARRLRAQKLARRAVPPVVHSADRARERTLPEAVPLPDLMPPVSGHARVLPPPPIRGEEVSLGEVARRLRAERAARRAQMSAATAPAPLPAAGSAAERARRRAARPPQPVPASSHISREEGREAEAVIRVRRGDSLWKLARLHLGDGTQWQRLWQANPEIADPGLIHPGQRLRLPAADVPDAPAGLSAAAPDGALQRGLDLDLEQARARLAQLSPWAPLWLAPVLTPAPPAPRLAPRPSAARDRS